MNPQQEIEVAVFDAASRIEEPAARRAFIHWVFRGSPDDARRMNEVLGGEPEANRWFRRTSDSLVGLATEVAAAGSPGLPAQLLESAEISDLSQSLVPRYTILETIGGGSGGQVFLAEQLQPVCRKVAIKLLRSGLENPVFLAAFQREQQILASMNHPNIAMILDAGTTLSGRPYLVMELVEGMRITHYCDAQRLDLRQRLELFLQVCQAVQHAHQKGIIHRDIKPSNILVARDHSHALPKVIDFGIASVGGISKGNSGYSGTPSYMSPEQAGLEGEDADTRSDLFSLGVVLHELLAGPPPWAPDRLAQSAPPASIHLASLPAKDLAQLAANRRIGARQLISRIHGDLDAIIGKAIALDRRHRYETVDSLAADIRRHQDCLPVNARPAVAGYLIGRFLTRNRLACIAGIAVMIALLSGAGISVNYFILERKARKEAQTSRATVADLLSQATSRENIAQAAILLSQNRIPEAEAQLKKSPISQVHPSAGAAYVFRFLGERQAMLGRWPEAAESFELLMMANQDMSADKLAQGMDLLHAGPVMLEANRAATYHAMRQNMLSRLPYTRDSVAAEHLVKFCLLTPPDRAILEKLRPMAEILRPLHENVRLGPDSDRRLLGWLALATTLFDLRDGRYERARKGAGNGLAITATPSCRASLKLVLAMAAQAQGDKEVARRELAEADFMIQLASKQVIVAKREDYDSSNGSWNGWAEARIFHREAAALIGR